MTHCRKRGLVFALVALLMVAAMMPLLTGAAPEPQAGDAVVRFAPQEASVGVGETITLEVYVENVTDLYGLDLKFAYDTSLAVSQDASMVLASEVFDPSARFVVRNTIDNGTGTGWLGISKLGQVDPFTGSGKVGEFRLEGVSDGFALIGFTEVKGSTMDGDLIELGMVDALIEVGDGGPTPTASPTSQPIGDVPTATPTATPTVSPEPTVDVPNCKVALPIVFGD